MTEHFPHRYEVSLDRTGSLCARLSAPPRSHISGGPPPQFGGIEECWSPEHLLLAAVSLCLMTTFQALAHKARLAVQDYQARAEGVLDKTAAGIVFTEIALQVKLTTTPGDAERAERLLHTAEKHCIIANSLRVPVALAVSVTPGAQPHPVAPV